MKYERVRNEVEYAEREINEDWIAEFNDKIQEEDVWA